jgi:hypothetical protein
MYSLLNVNATQLYNPQVFPAAQYGPFRRNRNDSWDEVKYDEERAQKRTRGKQNSDDPKVIRPLSESDEFVTTRPQKHRRKHHKGMTRSDDPKPTRPLSPALDEKAVKKSMKKKAGKGYN